MTEFDFANPDYARVIAERAEKLRRLRETPGAVEALRAFYAEHPAEFIADWGLTFDPRNKNRGLPVEVPFVLFERQREMVQFILDRMAGREPGLIEKSRDCGASWLVACLAGTLCLFHRNVVIGIGSRTEDKVDRSGDPDCLFWKLRFFLAHLPPEFRGGWDESHHSAHMRCVFPATGSAIVGEAGDAIGRGGRSTLYVIDEAAFLERPQLIEASLASNTDCRIDVSTPNGRANAFAVKRWSGRVQVFTFGWRSDPRKGEVWYERQCRLLDAVTRAQEIDLRYDASVEGILIPAEWVQASVGAHMKLGITPSGERRAALDVADEGKDRNALIGRHGILVEHAESWSGKGSDIYRTTVRAMGLCEQHGYAAFDYDADGLGAGVRGDAVQINGERREAGKGEIAAEPFRGSGAVSDPEGSLVEGRLNRDYFANLKAQAWWALRLRFQATYRAVVEHLPFEADAIISLSPDLPQLIALTVELSQPTYSLNSAGKILIDKTPDGAMSPNLADALMIAFGPRSISYFGGAVAVSAPSAPAAQVLELPQRRDMVFGVVAGVGDAAAVVFCGTILMGDDGTRGPRLHVLDYDLQAFNRGSVEWPRSVAERLVELAEVCAQPGCLARLFADDPRSGYAALFGASGFLVSPLAEHLPPPPERLGLAQPLVRLGLAPLCRPAAERVVEYRGNTRNFLRELLSAEAPNSESPLAQALATAVLLVYCGPDGEMVLPAATVPPRPVRGAKPASAPSAPAPRRFPSVLLAPGPHEIDGVGVDVTVPEDNPGCFLVSWPLRPGRHVIDGKVSIVAPLGIEIDPRAFTRR
ncbi:MAG TPA: hypothetical protein VMU67_13905 [Steroidobacteraceae bacterium]|nr:hypothetical protein [Steroidobacteraceae bacterium]